MEGREFSNAPVDKITQFRLVLGKNICLDGKDESLIQIGKLRENRRAPKHDDFKIIRDAARRPYNMFQL